MAKQQGGLTLLVINAMVIDARELRGIETKLLKLGEILTQVYVRSPDKNGTYQIRNATYVVQTTNPANLRRTLTQMGNSGLKTRLFINS